MQRIRCVEDHYTWSADNQNIRNPGTVHTNTSGRASIIRFLFEAVVVHATPGIRRISVVVAPINPGKWIAQRSGLPSRTDRTVGPDHGP